MQIESERLADFAAALRPRLAGDLRTDALHRALYATDASLYREPPMGALIPRTVDDVQAAMEEAARFSIPVLPRGGGSSLAGSAVGAGLVIDTTNHLRSIIEIDAEARTATVEPGVILDHLNAALSAHGLRVGPDPASSSRATLGGMLGTNATGTHSIQYGAIVDHVLSSDVLLAGGVRATFAALTDDAWVAKTRLSDTEGEIYRRVDAVLNLHEQAIRRDTPRHWRRAGGYRLERLIEAPEVDRGPGRAWDGTRNLAQLLAGAEGTLGFTTRMTVGLVETPAASGLGVVHFSTRTAALEAVEGILTTHTASIELFDKVALKRAAEIPEYAARLTFVQRQSDGDLPGALLFVEYDGESEAAVHAGLDRLRQHLGPSAIITHALTPAAIADVWTIRKVGLGLAMSARLPLQPPAIIEDAAVPVEHLPAYIRELEAAMAEVQIEAVMYAHASAGCLHVRPFIDTKQQAGVDAMDFIARASADLARKYGGVIASEHGDGRARGALAEYFYSAPLYAAYQATKKAFDPNNLLNPRKIVDAPPLTEALRLGPSYRADKIETGVAFLDASGRDIGVAEAVEACNGQGVCRKVGEGTMCPPFMATREEKDSTRGRANALREALSGGLSRLTGPEVAEAMDLCVACKACSSECPAEVDMAALKTVWQEQKWKTEKPSLRTRLFANMPKLASKTAGPLARIANRVNASALARKQMERLGMASQRGAPVFATDPFTSKEAAPLSGAPRVVLYADTFARFQEPHIARAAMKVFAAAGVSVEVPPYRCCGRTQFSKGFVSEAARLARQLVDTYAPFTEAGVPIVGLEPSCILTLRDEIPRLLPDDPRAKVLADRAVTFEEWVTANAPLMEQIEWLDAGEALVHGHCHQKALSTMLASQACLGVAGYRVKESGAGCCGVAGAFGYEAEHYDLSVAIGEDRLAPAVRAVSAETVVVAAGTSCREQIEHLTHRKALHPAEALAARIRP